MKIEAARLRASLSVLTLLPALWLLSGIPAVQAQPVAFTDPQMKSAVVQQLQAQGVFSGLPVTQAQMLLLTNLPAANFGIQDTAGLQYASNLTALFLNGNPVTNYDGITNLTLLTELDINNVTPSLTNMAFVSGMWRLQHLEISGNLIADMSPLAGKTNLQFLDLSRLP